jgi:hypothetical protein
MRAYVVRRASSGDINSAPLSTGHRLDDAGASAHYTPRNMAHKHGLIDNGYRTTLCSGGVTRGR